MTNNHATPAVAPVGGSGVSRPDMLADQQRVANLLAMRALMADSASAFAGVNPAVVEAQILEGLGLATADLLHPCQNHRPVQHRDGKPPWCNACGLTASGRRPASRFDREETGR